MCSLTISIPRIGKSMYRTCLYLSSELQWYTCNHLLELSSSECIITISNSRWPNYNSLSLLSFPLPSSILSKAPVSSKGQYHPSSHWGLQIQRHLQLLTFPYPPWIYLNLTSSTSFTIVLCSPLTCPTSLFRPSCFVSCYSLIMGPWSRLTSKRLLIVHS